MMAMFFTYLTQASAGEWSPVPILSVGALISICGAAVTFGVVKSRTDGIPEWRREMREDMAKISADIGTVRAEVGRLAVAVARMQGSGGHEQ